MINVAFLFAPGMKFFSYLIFLFLNRLYQFG